MSLLLLSRRKIGEGRRELDESHEAEWEGGRESVEQRFGHFWWGRATPPGIQTPLLLTLTLTLSLTQHLSCTPTCCRDGAAHAKPGSAVW